MKPVLFELGGFEVQSYGVSKALAALVALWLLQRELARRGRNSETAFALTLAAFLGGFVGAKLYYLAEASGDGLAAGDFGASGFTWYGGLIGGALAVVLVARRTSLPLGLTAGMAAIPLAVGYAIGRLGCLLAGDGTYGTPTDVPWAMSFPEGAVPTTAEVHPAPLYGALAMFAVAAVLWRIRDRLTPVGLFGAFSVLFGLERFLVEFVRLNHPVAAGLTGAQLFSLFLVALGWVLLVRERRPGRLDLRASLVRATSR